MERTSMGPRGSTLLGSPLPVVAAPMAGGPSNPRLAAAVTQAGGFPFLAGGYTTPELLADEIAAVRTGSVAFGVNLFAPNVTAIDERAFRRYADQLQPEAARYGIDLSGVPIVEDDDRWHDKLDLLMTDPVPVVSVTFGVPAARDIGTLRRAGTRVLATVTTVDEARAAADAGVDGLVAQGSNAGGHSGTHDARRRITAIPTAELTRAVIATTGLPVVAAGGVDGPAAVSELVAAGAAAVAVGTLLVRTDESGASETYKNALGDRGFTETIVTRAFTGRPARALRNAFASRYDPIAPTGYPAIHHLTRTLRLAAAAAADPQRTCTCGRGPATGTRRQDRPPRSSQTSRPICSSSVEVVAPAGHPLTGTTARDDAQSSACCAAQTAAAAREVTPSFVRMLDMCRCTVWALSVS
jgi:nitronate monooxygenase